MANERDDVIVLVDEEGKESQYEFVANVEMNDKEYLVLMPVDNEGELSDDVEEAVILMVEHDEDGETLVSIEDENEEMKVFEEFLRIRDEEYEFEE